MRTTIAMISLLLCVAGAAHADCVAQSAATRTHLIELFTSEGCSSCLPADEWLRGLHANAQIQPLEWHVDYWDSLGWPDRFDDPRYTERQRQLAARSERGIVYTPEVALDGREWGGWNHNSPAPAVESAPTHLILHVAPGNPLRVALQSRGLAGNDWRAYFVVTEDGLSTPVPAGENKGVVLHHDHTVRAFTGPLPLDHAQAELKFPRDMNLRNAAVVAFVQNESSGAIAQTVRQPMVQCR